MNLKVLEYMFQELLQVQYTQFMALYLSFEKIEQNLMPTNIVT